jgi:hypothetical protein
MGTVVTNTYKSFSDHGDIVTPISSDNVAENLSEIRPENGIRDAAGKFTAGNPGGPGRLPSTTVTEAIRADLRAGKAIVVKDKLFGLMESARRESVQLAAAQELIDRSEGKAVQNVRHAGVFMVMAPGAEALAALDGWAEDE